MAKFELTISTQQCSLLTFRPHGVELPDVVRFESLVTKLGISSITYTEKLVDSTVLEALITSLGAPRSSHPREIVLVCGAYLEEQISLVTQFLLITGYPIILLRDLIAAKNAAHSYVHDLRLTQSGAVATTSQQLIYEWAASETDPIRFAMLKEVLFHGAPR